jgi:hypothetical protein
MMIRAVLVLLVLLLPACATPRAGVEPADADAGRVRWSSMFHDGVPADSLVMPPGGSRCARGLPDSVALVGPPRPHVAMDDTLLVAVAGLFCAADGTVARLLVERDGRSYSLPIYILAEGDVQASVDWIRARRRDGTLEPIGYVRSRRSFFPQSALCALQTGTSRP